MWRNQKRHKNIDCNNISTRVQLKGIMLLILVGFFPLNFFLTKNTLKQKRIYALDQKHKLTLIIEFKSKKNLFYFHENTSQFYSLNVTYFNDNWKYYWHSPTIISVYLLLLVDCEINHLLNSINIPKYNNNNNN